MAANNTARPHSALGGATPAQAYPDLFPTLAV